MNHTTESEKYFELGTRFIPGGVNSPVRAFKSVGGTPVLIQSAKGSKLYDIDGNEYIDFVGAWGPMIMGHSYEPVIKAVQKSVELGMAFGTTTKEEALFAEYLVKLVPSFEKVRLVNSGTEAVMTALRIARAATGKPLIIKFEGGYHGHSDALLAKAGSGLATQGIPDSRGVSPETAKQTISIPFNDLAAMEQVLEHNKGQVACLIAEALPANMGVVLPLDNYWKDVQAILKKHSVLLILDEVITGFRLALTGAQGYFNIQPDLSTFGKIMGGGMPIGAVGGRAELMDLLAPLGGVYQAGTLSGNLTAVTAGHTMLSELEKHNPYSQIKEQAQYLANSLRNLGKKYNIPMCVHQCESLLTLFFSNEKVIHYSSACTSDTNKFKIFFHECLKNGIYLPPSQYEAWFVSAAHSRNDIDKSLSVIEKALQYVR